MLLFHKLSKEDQYNAIHYCMHLAAEDMLEEGVQLEPFSDEDKRIRDTLERVINEAKQLPEEQQFDFIVNHKEAGQMIFDIAVDMARSAFYPSDDELVIHYESLRNHQHKQEEETLIEETLESVEDLITPVKKPDHSLN